VRVELIDETGRFRQPEVVITALGRLADELGVPAEHDVTLVLVDDDEIARRNREHRGVDGATDVLAYPLSEPDDIGMPMVPALGDIVISLDTAERQAPAHDLEPLGEVLVLAAHALVHLLGEDHPDEASWRAFHQAQDRILALAGVGGRA
jgi:probable rRNA maturation factor